MPSARPPAIQLFVPHLLPERDDPRTAASLRSLAARQRLLSRSVKTQAPAENSCALLCAAFGIQRQQDWPVAALTLLGDGSDPGARFWLRADPVHLQPTQGDILLADCGNLSQQEAAGLIETLNGHFAADGMRLRAPHPRRWYLDVSAPAAITTTSASQAVGRSIDALLPQGPDALQWHRWFNEAQMLLHEHPVNQQRESRGEPTINSVWFWGGGRLPAPGNTRCGTVWADDPLLRGLALWSGVDLEQAPQDARAWLEQAGIGEHMVLLDALAEPALRGDGPGWIAQSALLERTWFAPLGELLARRRVAQVTLTTQHAGLALGYTVLPGDLWKFWRRDSGSPRPAPQAAARA